MFLSIWTIKKILLDLLEFLTILTIEKNFSLDRMTRIFIDPIDLSNI